MTIDALIHVASERPLRAEDVEAAANGLRVTVVELYDLFAKRVAQRYLSGELSYTVGDAAMNELFGYGIPGGGPELSQIGRAHV